MQIASIMYIESMLSILLDSIATIKRLDLLSDLIPSFETFTVKRKRISYFNELLICLIKSELIIELAYEFATKETREHEILLEMLDNRYRLYLSRIIYLAQLYDFLLKKSLTDGRINNSSTIFQS